MVISHLFRRQQLSINQLEESQSISMVTPNRLLLMYCCCIAVVAAVVAVVVVILLLLLLLLFCNRT